MGRKMAKSMSEIELLTKIERAFAGQRGSSLGLALGDDAALFQSRKGHETVLTCDWFLEGSHFLRAKHPPDSVGWKCLARATSDIAAMGAVPRCFLLSLALPAPATGKWLSGFLGGLKRASRALGCELAGGDTTRRDEILISVTVIGEVHEGRAIRRSGAQVGDLLYASGTLGEAELGFRMLREGKGASGTRNGALLKHLYPEPRLEIGKWLTEKRLASAMMDLSDGLSTDLARLCAASGVGARLSTEKLPVSALVGRKEGIPLALHGGDDYELLFAVRPSKSAKIPGKYRGVALTQVGEIVPGKNVLVEDGGKWRALAPGGWDPFRKIIG
jgi:thiamine-monophosphate kinase